MLFRKRFCTLIDFYAKIKIEFKYYNLFIKLHPVFISHLKTNKANIKIKFSSIRFRFLNLFFYLNGL